MKVSSQGRIQFLINRCLSGKESKEERDELNSYFTEEIYVEEVQKAILHSFSQSKELVDMPIEKQGQILKAIHSLDKDTPHNKKHYWKWVGAAAILFIILFYTVWHLREPAETHVAEQQVTNNKRLDTLEANVDLAQSDRNPAKESATLEMADGSSIDLNKLTYHKVLEVQGMTIQRSTGGVLLMQLSTDLSSQTPTSQIHTITTPRGGTYKVVLPDGTEVHLNASSKLSFPTSFSQDIHRVSLEGEAYFKVAHDDHRQFIVQISKGKIKQDIMVYGTEFNVNAYPESDRVVTTLVEGKIKVRQGENEQMLKPMQQVITSNGQFRISTTDLESELAWNNNMFYFADEPLSNVMAQIGRWYDIDINYSGQNTDIRLWGQISRSKKLSEILEILEQTNDIQFIIKDKEVIIVNRHPFTNSP